MAKKKYERLKNFSTEIKVETTLAEIETILAKHGASHIYKMYDSTGRPQALAFKTQIGKQSLAFKLPMEEEKIIQVFKNSVEQGKLPKRYAEDTEQARRTGWRIIKDWLDAQMALLEINLVTFDEVFLPYLFNEQRNQTMY
ncbi:hypothetical protein MUP79_03360 [Candidatus Bathyarchaeota archaeon]|nr:hypothetical protein [Candidatus Bathyarchaeota archaeon]